MIPTIVIPAYGLEQEHHRLRAVEIVAVHLVRLGWPVEVAPGKNAAAARNRGACATEAEVLVFNDADTLVDLEQIRTAASLAADAPGLVFAFDWYRRLSRKASERLAHPEDAWGAVTEQMFLEPPSHGCVAISRASFEEVGGYDERLEAFEDIAFTCRAEALWPHRRVSGPAVHLWHPRLGDAGDPAWEARFAASREVWEAEYPSVVVPHG